MNGSGSTDVDGDSLTYLWTIVSGPPGSTSALSNVSAVAPTLFIDKPGSFVISLVVTDAHGAASLPDQVGVSTVNSNPVANAGPDQTVPVGLVATLDGSASTDVDGDALSYSWSFVTRPVGSSASLSNASAVKPTFTVDMSGQFQLRLTVSDGVGSSTDDVLITTSNTAPHADAGPDRSGRIGTTVMLDGSASSDVDGNPLTYLWSLTSVPAGSTAQLSSPTAIRPTLVIDKPGTYVAQLVVNDGFLSSNPDTATITTENSPPTADAGPDQSFVVGQVVILTGAASSDPDGDALTFAWSFTSRPPGSTAVYRTRRVQSRRSPPIASELSSRN